VWVCFASALESDWCSFSLDPGPLPGLCAFVLCAALDNGADAWCSGNEILELTDSFEMAFVTF